MLHIHRYWKVHIHSSYLFIYLFIYLSICLFVIEYVKDRA